jgi:hypothetical protein
VIEVQHRRVQNRVPDDEGPRVVECLGHDLAQLSDDDVNRIDPATRRRAHYRRRELARQRHLVHGKVLSDVCSSRG